MKEDALVNTGHMVLEGCTTKEVETMLRYICTQWYFTEYSKYLIIFLYQLSVDICLHFAEKQYCQIVENKMFILIMNIYVHFFESDRKIYIRSQLYIIQDCELFGHK